MAPAERMRASRQRRRDGRVLVRLELHRPFVEDLVRLHLLASDHILDPDAVATAFLTFAQRAWQRSVETPRELAAGSV